jgi:hypothetical protein
MPVRRLLSLFCVAFAVVSFPANAEDPLDFIVFLKNGGNDGGYSHGWYIQKQLDGSSKLAARNGAKSPAFCIEHLSTKGIGQNPRVILSFGKILTYYAKQQVGVKDSFRHDCVNYQFLLVERDLLEKTLAQKYLNGTTLLSSHSALGEIDFNKIKEEVDEIIKQERQLKIDQSNTLSDLSKNSYVDSKEKVYIISLSSKYSFDTRNAFCTLSSYKQNETTESKVITALFFLLSKQKNRDGAPQVGGPKTLYFSSLNEMYANYNEKYESFRSEFGGCIRYIDFAKNIETLRMALSRDYPSQRFQISAYDSTQIMARALGFTATADYEMAMKMGVSKIKFYALAEYGITTMQLFSSAIAEMLTSKYSESRDIDELIQYLEDRREAKRTSSSPMKVRANRENYIASENAKLERQYTACLSSNGYFRTNNSAAKSLIKKKCS